MIARRNGQMSNQFAVVAAAAALFALSGCASANRYHEPVAPGSAHLIGSSVRNGVFDWQRLSVDMVDNYYVPSKVFGNDATTNVALSPSPHHVVAEVTFNREFGGGGPYSALLALQFEPRAEQDYRLAGQIRDTLYEVWVEDSKSGERVSEIASAPYREQPKITYVPIYVPPSR